MRIVWRGDYSSVSFNTGLSKADVFEKAQREKSAKDKSGGNITLKWNELFQYF